MSKGGAEYASLQMPAQTPLEALLAGQVPLPAEEAEYPPVYYWLWLADVLGPASMRAGRVLDIFGDAETAYHSRETGQFIALLGNKIAARVAGKALNPAACAARMAQCAAKGVQVLTFADAEYPPDLTHIPDPPLVLYCTGALSALLAPARVGMVGTRRPSAYGVSAAARFGGEFARSGAVIISGLAEGLDAEGHNAAIAQGAVTIGVMGVPITKTFPAANIALRGQIEALGGLTISEYPPDFSTGKTRSTFLQRNRIIAALSHALVVVEAREKSGTMSTVYHAERYEKPVFAVPGSVFSSLSEGTNLLLREGRAKMLLQSGDVLSVLGLIDATQTTAAKANCPLSPNAKKVLACMSSIPVRLETLTTKSGVAMGAVLGALGELEVAGRINSLPGGQYTIRE